MIYKMSKILPLTIAVLLCVVVVQAIIIWWFNATYNPFVVTNAYNKRFDPKEFQFGYYSYIARNEGEFNPALLKMFPPGSDKTYVDQILVKQAHAEAAKNQLSEYHEAGDSDYSYIYGTWQVRFIFDKSNRTKMMKTGKVLHYGTDPLNTFWEEKAHERQQ
jgi:hypothetical protein